MEPSAAELSHLRDLYQRGLYRQAWELAQRWAPVRQWQGTSARLLAGRLATQWGAPRLGRQLHLAAWRNAPAHPEAIYYCARYRLERFGPLAAWRFIQQYPDWSDSPVQLQADWWALCGHVCARFQDFDRAQRYLHRAESLAPDHPWPLVERAGVAELAEQYEEALAIVRRALELRPWYRPAVQFAAHLLARLGRDDQARELLAAASEQLESGLVTGQYALLLLDTGHYEEALRALDRYEWLSPLLESEPQQWLAARRADAFYYLGRWSEAIDWANVNGEPFYSELATRLAAATPTLPAKALLKFPPITPPFTPEEWLSAYWNQPLPEEDLSEPAPPPDGLPDAAARRRWEEAGWCVRDFRLTIEAAHALIGRGIPFCVVFTEGGYNYHRLCVGADPLRCTIFLIDPQERRPVEGPLRLLQERQEAFGPRAWLAVPRSSAACLEGVVLPEADAYDELYQLQCRLLERDRAAAVTVLRQMQARFPEHRLLLFAELALAHYDANPYMLLRLYSRLLARFPHEPTWVLSQAAVLRDLYRLEEREALLAAESLRSKAEPLVLLSYAQAIMTRPADRPLAARLVRRALRERPTVPAGYFLLGTIEWEAQNFRQALDYYRFAWTLEEREDQFAEAYSRAARALEQVPEALRLFQLRGPRAELPSPGAVRAIYWLLLDRDEPAHAAMALDLAIRKLRAIVEGGSLPPPSALTRGIQPAAALGELLLFRAERHAAAEQWDAAHTDLTDARPYVSPVDWHRAAARIASYRPDFHAALQHCREIARLLPFDRDTQRALIQNLEETDGRAAVRLHLQQLCRSEPSYYPWYKLRVEYVSGDPDGDDEQAVEDLLQLEPEDAWAWRQLALLRSLHRKLAAAYEAIQRAAEYEPHHRWYFSVLSQVHKRADRLDEAREALREALRRDVDQELVIHELVQLSPGREEKRAALAFIAEQLRRQSHTGEGLVAFYTVALQTYAGSDPPDPEDHERLLETLQELLDAQPDLWYTWSATVHQLANLGRLEEAAALARSAIARFPLVAKLRLDLAQVYEAQHKGEESLEVLQQAVAIAPDWPTASRALAEALIEVSRDPPAAVRVMRAAVGRNPRDPVARLGLAYSLWEADAPAEALTQVQTALLFDPEHELAWQWLHQWSERLEQPEAPLALARRLTQLRPGNPVVWLHLARVATHPRDHAETLAALDRAISLNPRLVEAYDLKAERLAEMGRYEEALAAAQPPVLANDLPLNLQGRVAWVEARRGNYAAAIPPMQALVALDPNYLWGWHQLAEWYNETGRAENYLEAASELVRLQPNHPVPLAIRGDARLKTGDREGGKADLREALQLAPGYSFAAAVLFDACLEDEEYREARQALALLQEHAAGAEVALKQLQLAVRLHDVETACRAFTEICESTGHHPYPLQKALEELHHAGWQEQAWPILRNAWQSGGPFHPWVPLFWIESPEGKRAEPADRLRAVEILVKAYPKFAPGYDTKAELLTQLGRFDEALAACQPPELQPCPIELRARAAWVEAQRGRRTQAIAIVRQLVQEQPDFSRGWRLLADWYAMGGQYRDSLEAIERLLQLEPSNPLGYLYRGEARRQLNDRRGARSDFQRAFELDPTLELAGVELIGEWLAAGDVDAAMRVHARLAEHHDTPRVRLRGLQLACVQKQREAAVNRFHQMARDPGTPPEVLREAAAAFDAQGWEQSLTAELKALVDEGVLTPAVAALWAERCDTPAHADRLIERLMHLRSIAPPAVRAAVLAMLARRVQRNQPVQGLVTQFSDLLRADTEAWAAAGDALTATGQFAHAAAWMADWQNRPGLTPSMLRPLIWCYRVLEQDDRAAEVVRAALSLGGPAEEWVLTELHLWAALDAALHLRTGEAAQNLALVEERFVHEGLQPLQAMVRALLVVLNAAPPTHAAALREAQRLLRAASHSPVALPGVARAYRQTVQIIAETVGTPRARLWAFWQRLFPWIKS